MYDSCTCGTHVPRVQVIPNPPIHHQPSNFVLYSSSPSGIYDNLPCGHHHANPSFDMSKSNTFVSYNHLGYDEHNKEYKQATSNKKSSWSLETHHHTKKKNAVQYNTNNTQTHTYMCTHIHVCTFMYTVVHVLVVPYMRT